MTATKKPRPEPVVAIIDFPWPYKTYSTKGRTKCPKYDTMELHEIAALGPTINQQLGNCAVIHVWVTDGLLPDALAMCATWGWEYVTWRAWKKTRLGLGYWKRANSEIVLTFKKGKPRAPARGTQGRTIFEGKPLTRKHSSKPDALHNEVERHYPASTKIELFARALRDGWRCFGYDVGSAITSTGIVPLPAASRQTEDGTAIARVEQAPDGVKCGGVRCSGGVGGSEREAGLRQST